VGLALVVKTGVGAAPETSAIQFRDVTPQAGIHFLHNNGAFGTKYLPETMGPGVAFIDYDNDGWPDIFLVNGMDWPGHLRKDSAPAPPGWIMTKTATWISWLAITSSGRPRRISIARSTARANRIARRNRTKARPCGSGTTAATARLKT